MLGIGIFTTDGQEWHHSRELLRPNFNRSQVRDLDSFEVHIANLISAIPRDGSAVDLQELFFRLTIDSATEFLFGESTHCLQVGTSTVSNARFAEAFNRGQEAIAKHSRFGMFGFLVDKTKFKQDAAFVHDFVDGYVQKGLAKRNSLLSEKPNDTDRYIFLNELIRDTEDPIRIRAELYVPSCGRN